MRLCVEGGAPLKGRVQVPADKSITHRALILAALARGDSEVVARDAGLDNHSTAGVLAALGVPIEHASDTWQVEGCGPRALVAPVAPLDCGNSGTTMRLLAGVLAGAGVPAVLTGDASLARRPMGRVCRPLRHLGGVIAGEEREGRERPPLRVDVGQFGGGEITLEVASAQVKSALLLAGICSGEAVTVREPALTRDHSERMLRAAGVDVQRQILPEGGAEVAIGHGATLAPAHWEVPGDFSSAAFLLAAGLLVDGSDVTIADVGVNPTRTGLLEILEEYGASVEVSEWREAGGEPVATLRAQPSILRADFPGGRSMVVAGATIPLLIDELVVLAAIAARADGVTIVQDAAELRVKESDRVRETVRLLGAFGIQAEERSDGYLVRGPQTIVPARVDVSADHRLALTAAVLALAAPGESVLSGFDVAAVSYPSFVATLEALGARARLQPE